MAKSSKAKSETSTKMTEPALLGVTLPVSATMAAAKDIAEIWRGTFTALAAAMKGKVNDTVAAAKGTPEAVAAQPSAPPS